MADQRCHRRAVLQLTNRRVVLGDSSRIVDHDSISKRDMTGERKTIKQRYARRRIGRWLQLIGGERFVGEL